MASASAPEEAYSVVRAAERGTCTKSPFVNTCNIEEEAEDEEVESLESSQENFLEAVD